MGYRLEISKKFYSDCGGKLFGYISDEHLHQCKSWHWLKDHGYFEEEPELEDVWTYGITHQIELLHYEYEEFIKMYIEDYNKYSPYGNTLTLDDFKDSLSADNVIIEWW